MDKNLLKIPRIKPMLWGLAGAALLQALCIIGEALSLSAAISNVWNGQRIRQQVFLVAFFLLAFTARQAVQFFRDRALTRYAHARAIELRKRVLEKIFDLGPNFVQKAGTASVVSLNIEGVSQVENYLTLMLSRLANIAIIPWVIAAFLLYLDVRSGIIVLIAFPVVVAFMVVLGNAARAKASRQYEGFQRMGNHFLDVLRGLDTLRLLGLNKRFEKNVYEVSEDYRKATMSTLRVAIMSTFALDFFTTLSVAVIALFLGIHLMDGSLALFPALAVLIVAPDFFLPLRDLAQDYHATLNGGTTLGEIFHVLDIPSPKEDSEFALHAWGPDHRLRLENVDLCYDGQLGVGTNTRMGTYDDAQAALRHISFEWRGYGKIGVVGLSGSGKSTLIKMLGGFLMPEDTSDIKIDGQNLPHLHQSDWQKQLFYIPQDPYLFADTLRNNIRFYVPTASDGDVMQAAQRAGLSEVIEELPEGLETLIGEGGESLSGGQGQRIALARAFLDERRKVLLFDEPTAHVDIETEDELQQTILPLLEGHLVFFATHRIHWMKEMDYILVMEDGRLVEQGGYDDLRKRADSAYNRLAREIGGGIA